MSFLEDHHRAEGPLLFVLNQGVRDVTMTNGEVNLDHMGEAALPGFSTGMLLFFPF